MEIENMTYEDLKNKYKMSRETKERYEGYMNRMDEEMSMLANRFKLTNSSDVIAMHRNLMLWQIKQFGLETYGNFHTE
jgi:uncharacterized membrane protein (UPF0127 family)